MSSYLPAVPGVKARLFPLKDNQDFCCGLENISNCSHCCLKTLQYLPWCGAGPVQECCLLQILPCLAVLQDAAGEQRRGTLQLLCPKTPQQGANSRFHSQGVNSGCRRQLPAPPPGVPIGVYLGFSCSLALQTDFWDSSTD